MTAATDAALLIAAARVPSGANLAAASVTAARITAALADNAIAAATVGEPLVADVIQMIRKTDICASDR